MRLTFTQGIARYQTDINATPIFLQKSSGGQYIDLIVSPDPTVIVFAHGDASYIFEESRTVTHAWGPFSSGPTKYLYWDVSLLDGTLTRAATSLPLVVSQLPPVPQVDQHWFDTSSNLMKVWNGFKWLEKIRVFAATYSSQVTINPAPLGTQVGLNGDFDAGNILLDAFNKPLRQSDGSFLSTVVQMAITGAIGARVQLEAAIVFGMADESIPKFSFVQVTAGKKFRLARSTDVATRVSGIVLEDFYQSEVGTVVTGGLVRNSQWSFAASSIKKPVFCGPTGAVTITPPVTGVSQILGYIYDTDAIYVEIQPAVVLTGSTGGTLVTLAANGELALLSGTASLNIASITSSAFLLNGKPIVYADGTSSDGSAVVGGGGGNTDLQLAYDRSSSGRINLTSGKNFTLNAANSKQLIFNSATGAVTISGDLTVQGTTTTVNTARLDTDKVEIHQSSGAYTPFSIEPAVGVTPTANIVDVKTITGGSSVFSIGPTGSTTISTLLSNSINGINLTTMKSTLDSHVDINVSAVKHNATQISVNTSGLSPVTGATVQNAIESIAASLSAAGSVKGYQHVQSSASSVWTVAHNGNSTKVSAMVFDSANEQVLPDVVRATSSSIVTITFNTPITGTATILFF